MKTRQKQFATRKSNYTQQQHRFAGLDDWTEEDDALFRGRRYAAHPVATTVNVTKVSLLQEIFPETEYEILQAVLVAAQFQVDVAAVMLGDMVCETTKCQSVDEETMEQRPTPAVQSEVHPVGIMDVEMNDMDEDEDWSEVSMIVQQQQQQSAALTAVDMHPWVMVQDEWEVVDMEGEKVQTFAEVLRHSSAANTPYVSQLPKLRVVEPEKSRAPKMKTLSRSKSDAAAFDGVERGVKSFGARKRRFLKTRA